MSDATTATAAELPRRVRVQLMLTRLATGTLRQVGLRDWAISLRLDTKRARRLLYERLGSRRLSMPALHGMDLALDRIIGLTDGVFIEAGGFDGFTQSNTYFLERFRGWRGILVEPVPELAEQARRNRPGARVIDGALVPSGFSQSTVRIQVGDLMSTMTGPGAAEWAARGLVLGWRDPHEAEVPARTLSSIIDEAGGPSIDLLSLDVEGHEVQALAGLDFTRHAPRWILVEMLDIDTGRAAVGEILGKRYAEHSSLSPLDVLYRLVDPPGSSSASGSPADG